MSSHTAAQDEETTLHTDAAAHKRVSNNELHIRAASVDDIDAFVAIEYQCFGKGPYHNHRFDRSQYRYYLRNTQAVILLGIRHRVPVAGLVAVVGRGVRSDSARILSIAVIDSERRKGTGRRMLEKGVKLLRVRSCDRVYLEVAEIATSAVALFRSAGFKTVRCLPNYYGRSVHGTRMVQTLTSSQA